MNLRISLGRAAAMLAPLAFARAIQAQDRPVQRIATIVSVAVEKYGKAVDENGRLLSSDEYQEAIGFLSDARGVASRLPATKIGARAILDSIDAAMHALAINRVIRVLEFTLDVFEPEQPRAVDILIDHARRKKFSGCI